LIFYRCCTPDSLELVLQGYQDVHLPFHCDQKLELIKMFEGESPRVDSQAVCGFASLEPSEGELKLWVENADQHDGTCVFITTDEAKHVADGLEGT